MDNILFSLKRAFHKSVAFGRSILRHHGLTPARFDLLYLLFAPEGPFGSLRQSKLRRMLGVAAATVSRMLDALEDLGLVTRWREITDRRQRNIRLTEKGWRTIRRAIHQTITNGSVPFAVDNIITRRWWEDPETFTNRDLVASKLDYMRAQLGDSATLYYPWHPDD